MNNHASFNEVFLTDVAVEPADVIGTVNSGWQVARTTLANERRLGSALGSGPPRAEGRVMKEARAEARISLKPYQWYRERSGRPDLALSMARRFGRDRDPLVRQALARLHSLVCCAQWTSERARAARQQGRPTGPEGSVGKLHTSLIARAAADLHALIGGQRAVAGYDRDEFERVIPQILTSVPAVSIAGGTDEIQRNILGERILGLPKDPSDLGDTWKP
jgi:alkylation response protein AidB-like acyl-CoA dehydrogenase